MSDSTTPSSSWNHSSRRRRIIRRVHLPTHPAGFAVGALTCTVALLLVSVAAADDYTRRIRPKDQAAAKTAVLQKSDFGSLAVTGGATKVPHTDEKLCAFFD